MPSWTTSSLSSGAEKVNWREDFFCEHLFKHPELPQWEGVRCSRYVYARYFTAPPYPNRATVVVKELLGENCLIEIVVHAIKA